MATTLSTNTSPIRQELRVIIRELLDTHADFSDNPEGLPKICENMERGVFNAAITATKKHGHRARWDNPAFEDVYNKIALRVVSNLDPTSYVGNKNLIARLVGEEFQPHEIAFMAYPDLFPEVWREPQDRINKKMEKMFEVCREGTTNKFTCARCKKTECTYYELQTRSADEPMTMFITCIFCKKRWKQ
jgi:DNA-directed RNA polymerase subunit M/transcription elongation factor TFIIS